LANSFVENENGKLETSTTGNCSAITCDKICIGKFDLTDSLARVPPAKLPCVSPPSPCTTGGWKPSCSASETESWGSYTPKYLIGKRTVPVCDGAPVSAKLADGQIEDVCQECSGSDTPAALQLYTDAPTLEPTAEPTPSPTAEPTPSPTAEPTSYLTKTITVAKLNAVLKAQGAAFYNVQFIEVHYGRTDYLDKICNVLGLGSYKGTVGPDMCNSGADMYPSHCGQGWLGNKCHNGCGNNNYAAFTCTR